MPNRFQFRRDTAANWTSNDPVLSAGEPGYETDTGYLKVGTGSDAWTALKYLQNPDPFRNEGSGTYSFVLGDSNKVIRFTSGSAVSATLQPEATTDFPIGTELGIRQAGAGTVSVTTTSLTINGTIPTFSQHVETKLRKVGSDEWDVVY